MVLSVAVPLWLRGPGELPVPPARPIAQPTPLGDAAAARADAFCSTARRSASSGSAWPPGSCRTSASCSTAAPTIDLATLRPTQAEPVWAAAATGKYPPKNGIRSECDAIASAPTTPIRSTCCPTTALRTRCSYQGFVARGAADVGVAARAAALGHPRPTTASRPASSNWPLTHPARAERRATWSATAFDEAASSPLRLADAQAGDPTTAVDIAREVFDRWQAAPVARRPAVGRVRRAAEPTGSRRARWDRAYARGRGRARAAVRAAAHGACATRASTLRPHVPARRAAGAVRRRPARRPAAVGARSVLRVHRQRGRTRDRRSSRRATCCSSCPGSAWSRTSLVKRLLARLLGEPDPHRLARARARRVSARLRHQRRARRSSAAASIVDLAPTVLYYLGLPVGRDMDGFARTDLFRAHLHARTSGDVHRDARTIDDVVSAVAVAVADRDRNRLVIRLQSLLFNAVPRGREEVSCTDVSLRNPRVVRTVVPARQPVPHCRGAPCLS